MPVPSFLRHVALKANSSFFIRSTIQFPLFMPLSSLSFAVILTVQALLSIWATLDDLIEFDRFEMFVVITTSTACNKDGMGMD